MPNEKGVDWNKVLPYLIGGLPGIAAVEGEVTRPPLEVAAEKLQLLRAVYNNDLPLFQFLKIKEGGKDHASII